MNTSLSKLVGKDKLNTLIKQWDGNKLLFRTLQKMLQGKKEVSRNACDKLEVVEYSNYALYLAHQAGYRKALTEVADLLPK